MKKCMCWCLSIIELKNARWNIEIGQAGIFINVKPIIVLPSGISIITIILNKFRYKKRTPVVKQELSFILVTDFEP